MNDCAIVTSASETVTSAGGAAKPPSRSSSGHSIVCISSTSSFGRIRANASRERNATFTSADFADLVRASRSST